MNCGELLAAAGVGKILRALDATWRTNDYDLMERLLRVVYALASVETAVQVTFVVRSSFTPLSRDGAAWLGVCGGTPARYSLWPSAECPRNLNQGGRR